MEEERALWSARIRETNDRAGLLELDGHLAALEADGASWARLSRLFILSKLVKLKQASKAGQREAFATAYGVGVPDGRWLYAYRLSDEAFLRLQSDLSRKGNYHALEVGYTPGLFVLWASEWFRRCYSGGGQRWDELAAAIGFRPDQAHLRSITSRGLELWGHKVIRSEHSREFLSSLARQGGFPTAAVQEGSKGWARTVLCAIVAPLLAEPAAGQERALQLAESQRERLPQLFRDEEFVALCADLALAIVNVRREFDEPAAAAGLPVVAWLKLHHPDWRMRLPLTTDERAADALIEDLMQVEAVATGAVSVERLFVRETPTFWREAVRLTLDGALDGSTMRAIEARDGRLRAFAAGEMARALPGELAMIEPPADGETSWTARATKRARGTKFLPFNAPIELDLRSGERSVARIALAGGKPRRGQIMVAVLDEGSDENPQALRLVGSGSGKYRATTVYVQVPANWRVDATAGETVVPLGTAVADKRLWRVVGGAFVTDPTGDRYRVRCGQADDAVSRIELIGQSPTWAQVDGDVDLFIGAPIAKTSRPEGALFVREIGERGWQKAPRPLPLGHYELGWRQDGILLDRRRIAVLPASAELKRSGIGRDLRFDAKGFEPASITPSDDAPVSPSASSATWLPRPRPEAVYRFDAVIEWADSHPLTVTIDYPCAASIARWDGRTLTARTRITLADLRDLVAVDRGSMQLVGELRDPQTRQKAEMSWAFNRELPMSSIETDLASLLLPASIDAEVRLGMHDGIEAYWHVSSFAVSLQRVEGGIVATQAIVEHGAQLCGRAIGDPSREVVFGDYSLLTDSNHRPIMLGPEVGGTWLVYLRAGDRVLSRPMLIHGTGQISEPESDLGRAMLRPPQHGLDEAITSVFEDACREDEQGIQTLSALSVLAASLRGLPPATFRVFELLSRRPDVLTRMAMSAEPQQREAVLALSDALPFAWCTVPKACWQDAQAGAFARGHALLASLGAEAVRFAKEMVDSTAAALVEREPFLAAVLMPQLNDQSLSQVAQAFLNRAVDRVSSAGSRYRDRLGDRLPEYFLGLPDHCLETLDAPCAAALAVVGEWTPGPEDIRHIKAVARNFPTFFGDAFAVYLQEHL